jgi:hypothetical protein
MYYVFFYAIILEGVKPFCSARQNNACGLRCEHAPNINTTSFSMHDKVFPRLGHVCPCEESDVAHASDSHFSKRQRILCRASSGHTTHASWLHLNTSYVFKEPSTRSASRAEVPSATSFQSISLGISSSAVEQRGLRCYADVDRNQQPGS